MNKTHHPFAIVLTIIAIAVAAVLLFKKYPASAPVTLVPTNIHYACTSGAIDASYTGDTVALTLSDGRTFVLPQTISASGVRYEKDGLVFVSKGDNSFFEENSVTTYNNCVANAATAVSDGDTKTFTDNGKTFTFSYPNTLVLSGGEIGYNTSWRNNTQTLGLSFVKVAIPRGSYPKTNFSEAWFTVGTSSDATAIKECLIATNGEQAKGITTINGVQYATFELGDAGAGNYYETTSYRTMRNSQCYAIEYTVHSTNLGAYDPSQGISQFDGVTVIDILESIVHSFSFLK